MTNSSTIIDAFNAVDGNVAKNQEQLHEVSGITEGKATIGGADVDATVAIADKNNAGGATKRTGVNQVGICYVDSENKTVYKTLDVVNSSGDPMPDGFGPEDIDFSSEYGVYVIVDEGGMKKGNGEPPTVYTAELKENDNGELQMVIQTTTTMNVKSAVVNGDGDLENSDKNIGFTQYSTEDGGKGNGVEGLAIDSQGNLYMGEQDTGIIYKVQPKIEQVTNSITGEVTTEITGFDCETAKPILDTGSNDLAGLDFNSNGDLIASFGNEAKKVYDPNSVVKFLNTGGDPSNPSFSGDCKVLFEGSSDTGTDNQQFDAEGVMVDSRDEIVIGSDNGLDLTNGGHRFDEGDSKVLVAPTEQDGSGLHA